MDRLIAVANGKVTLEDALREIMEKKGCYSQEMLELVVQKRRKTKEDVFLSYEQRIAKPDEEIFRRCVNSLQADAGDCLYVGDGGSRELETAQKLGMKAVQAVWYFKEGLLQPVGRKDDFEKAETPLEIIRYL